MRDPSWQLLHGCQTTCQVQPFYLDGVSCLLVVSLYLGLVFRAMWFIPRICFCLITPWGNLSFFPPAISLPSLLPAKFPSLLFVPPASPRFAVAKFLCVLRRPELDHFRANISNGHKSLVKKIKGQKHKSSTLRTLEFKVDHKKLNFIECKVVTSLSLQGLNNHVPGKAPHSSNWSPRNGHTLASTLMK